MTEIYPVTEKVHAFPVYEVDTSGNPVVNSVTSNAATLRENNFSGFGEQISVGILPTNQHTFNFEYDDTIHFRNEKVNGGAISFANSQVSVITAATTNSLAAYYTRAHIRYRAGQAIVCRFTTLFEATGKDGVLEMVGLSAFEDAWGIGYLDNDFGIIHGRSSGAQVSITSITRTSTTATVTTTTAHGFTTGDMISVRNTAQDEYIKCQRVTVTSPTTFTYIVDATAVTPATAYIGKLMYCTKVLINCYPLTNAIDKLDGTGNSGMTLDRTKGNVWELHIPYLGYGDIAAFVLYNGKFYLFDIVNYTNLNITPSISNPSLSLTIYCENTTNNTSRSIKCASLFAGLTGTETVDIGYKASAKNVKSGITTEVAVVSMRNNRTFQGRLNCGRVKLLSVTLATEGNGNNTVDIYIRKNAVIGTPSWAKIKLGTSCVDKDIAGTVDTTVVPYYEDTLSRNTQRAITFSADDPVYLEPEDTLTISAASASTVIVSACFNFVESKE